MWVHLLSVSSSICSSLFPYQLNCRFSAQWMTSQYESNISCLLAASSSIQYDVGEMVYETSQPELKSGGIFSSSPLSPFCQLECMYEGWSSSNHPDLSNKSTFLEQWKPEKVLVSEDFVECRICPRLPIMGFYETDFYPCLSLSYVGEILNLSQLYLIPINTIAFSTK